MAKFRDSQDPIGVDHQCGGLPPLQRPSTWYVKRSVHVHTSRANIDSYTDIAIAYALYQLGLAHTEREGEPSCEITHQMGGEINEALETWLYSAHQCTRL